MTADNEEFRLEILYALQSGPRRFEELWARVQEVIRSRMTLVRYLKALEDEDVIKKTRASHKTVFYEIMPGERGSWLLAARGPFYGPFYGSDVKWIIRSIRNKAIALHVAINYAFQKTMREEASEPFAKILAGRPRYRPSFIEPKLAKTITKPSKEDWSDSMISFSSRRYRMFLKALRDVLEKYPEHVEAYLRENRWEREHGGRIDILRDVLGQNVSAEERAQIISKAKESSEFKEESQEEYFNRLVRALQKKADPQTEKE